MRIGQSTLMTYATLLSIPSSLMIRTSFAFVSSRSASRHVAVPTTLIHLQPAPHLPLCYLAITTRTKTTTTTSTFSVTADSDNNDQDGDTLPLVQLIPPSSFAQYTLPHVPDDYIPLLPNQRLLCIGDVHGDLSALKEFLEVAQVYDRTSQHWTGGNAIVVQCGDVLDRGTEELACLELLANLSRQAERQGGKLIVLYGNHEALNAIGLFQYAYEGGNVEYEQKIGAGGILANVLMKQMKVAVQVGKTVCVHAGLTKDHLDDFGGIAGMNQQARKWMESSSEEFDNSASSYQTVDNIVQSADKRARESTELMPACLGGGIGAPSPVWMRDYSMPADLPPKNHLAQQMINDVLNALECDRMVIGHTPQRHINAALEGKAWRIDVGASRGVASGTPEVLEIVGGEEEQVNILNKNGRIPGMERQTLPVFF